MAEARSGLEVLRRAEGELRALLEAAVRDQRYSEVEALARWAQGLAGLLKQSNGAVHAARAIEAPAERRVPRPRVRLDDQPAAAMAPASRKTEYPRFERRGDRLVKIGWSKKSREEYEHRAEKRVVIAVFLHLIESVAPDRVFAVEEVMPVHDRTNGREEIPTYQVYLVVAWLKEIGLLVKHGRDGYRFERTGVDEDALEEPWGRLPKGRS